MFKVSWLSRGRGEPECRLRPSGVQQAWPQQAGPRPRARRPADRRSEVQQCGWAGPGPWAETCKPSPSRRTSGSAGALRLSPRAEVPCPHSAPYASAPQDLDQSSPFSPLTVSRCFLSVLILVRILQGNRTSRVCLRAFTRVCVCAYDLYKEFIYVKVYDKKLAHVIMVADKSKICRVASR